MKTEAHKWEFKPRFRRGAFGWRSQPAVQRVKQAVVEIKKVARKAPALAAEGAVTLLERLSPALEQVDSSSGASGTAVNHAISELVPILADAPVDSETRGPGWSAYGTRTRLTRFPISSGWRTTGGSSAPRKRSPRPGRTGSSGSRAWR